MSFPHRVRVEGELRAAPETPSRLTLVAHVDPGPRAVIEAVDINIKGVEGAAAIEPAEVIRVSGLEPGRPVRRNRRRRGPRPHCDALLPK